MPATMMRRSLPFEVKRSNSQTGEFEGYATVFHTVDDSWMRDIIAPGAFTESLPEFLKSGFVGGIGHDWNAPLGKPLTATEDGHGLFVSAKISDTAAGRDLRTLLQDGVITRMSIGFRATTRTYCESLADVRAHWAAHGYTPSETDLTRAADGCRVIEKARLYEFSPVAVPANDGAVITSFKSASGSRIEEHTRHVFDAVEEWALRIASLKALRERDGRGLSEAHQSELRRLLKRLEAVATAPAPVVSNANSAYVKFLEIQSRLAGAGVGT